MPAYTTVTKELAVQYPSLADKVGKTVTSGEIAAARSSAKVAKRDATKGKVVAQTPAPAKSTVVPRATRRAPRASRSAKGSSKKSK